MTECRSCELNAQADSLPVYERLHLDAQWRVAHAWSSLPGWLIATSRTHAASLDELPADAAAALGPLLRASTAALRQAVGCERTYVILFAEHGPFRHVHFHIVPRMGWFGDDDRAERVFRFLNVPEDERVPVPEREQLASRLGELIGRELASA